MADRNAHPSNEATAPDAPSGHRGYVHVYSGNGKGKSSAALGLTVRALGHGLRVFMVRFLRGSRDAGEDQLAERFSELLEIRAMGRDATVNPHDPDPVDLKWAEDGLALAQNALRKGGWDIVILDDINQVVALGLLDVDRVLELLDQRPPHVELVLTGEAAPPEIVAAADLVTEMTRIKHYQDLGAPRRPGID